MYKRIYFLFCLLFTLHNFEGIAQKELSGRIVDKDTKSPINYSSIILEKISSSDTTIVSFQFTDSDGKFSIAYDSNNANEFLLEIRHLLYETKVISLSDLSITTNKEQIIFELLSKKNELQEVIVYEKKKN